MPPLAQDPAPQVALLLARAARLLQAGRAAEAAGPLGEAARLQPGNAAVQHDLGVALLESGQAHAAIAALQGAIAGNPRFARAHLGLGMALEALGEAAPAIAAYRRAAELLPSMTEAHFRAGNLLDVSGHTAEAVIHFRRAAGKTPKTSLARLAAARALLAEQRDAEAELVLRQTLALDPGNPMAADLLGGVLADAGQFDAARESYERAVSAAPLLAGSSYDLVRCRRITAADADLLARMTAALRLPGLPPGQVLRVHLALGKARDDLDDPAAAMRHFDAADALRRSLVPYRAAAFAAQVEQLCRHFAPASVTRLAPEESAEVAPILILGLPRSGTTLVEQILASHRQVAAGGELPFWIERGAAWQSRLQPAADEAAFLSTAATDYLRMLRGLAGARGASHVTDKMPLNFVWAGLIHHALPGATIIHCRRRLIDTALSIHRTYFNPLLPLPTGGEDLVAYCRSYERLMAHWRRVLPPERFVEIEYEALTAAPEPEIRRLIAACGLPWDDACLQPHHTRRIVRTPSKWQARQPIYRSSVGGWRRYEQWLGPLRALLEDGAQDAAADAPEMILDPGAACRAG